jgi:hypothetical protein
MHCEEQDEENTTMDHIFAALNTVLRSARPGEEAGVLKVGMERVMRQMNAVRMEGLDDSEWRKAREPGR